MPVIPSEEEWLEQTARAQQKIQETQIDDPLLNDAPTHPIAQLQGPFEESIAESTVGSHNNWQVFIDAHARRNQVLTASVYERLCGRRWRQRPNEKYHPLWKLVSQIVFGIHLLAKGLAKSESAVIKILQVHVVELDGFIENATEDIALAFSDIEERLSHLRLPLGNIPVFNDMLTDDAFRQRVVKDHERIEHIIRRTALAMEDHSKDIEKGLQSVGILGMYLLDLKDDRDDQTHRLGAIYLAMVGNVEGWKRELRRLKHKAYKLAISLSKLHHVAFEIQRLVDIANRNSIVATTPVSRGHRHPKHIQNNSNRLATIKDSPLPQTPADAESYTAEAQVVPIVAGFTPPTLIKATSVQGNPAPMNTASMLRPDHQPKPVEKKKDLGNKSDRYYARSNTAHTKPQRSATEPVMSGSQIKNTLRKERKEEQQRPKTSSSKVTERSTAPEKESNKPRARFGSKINQFQKSTSKIFSVSTFSRSSIKKKENETESKIEAGKKQSKRTDRSWIDSETHDKQMSWSHLPGERSEGHTLASRKNAAPEFPHLFYLSLLEDQSPSDEGEDLKSLHEDTKDIVNRGDEHEITALPVMTDSMMGSKERFGPDDDMAAEVASTYSTKNRRFRAKNLHVPPLPKPKFSKSSNSDNNHVIYQNRNWLRPKPSTVFSFMSSKKGAEEASLNSGTSEIPSRSMSSSHSSNTHGSTAPKPSFNPTWATHKDGSSRNVDTPPISPMTHYNLTTFSSSAGANANMRPGTGQSSVYGSVGENPTPANSTSRKPSTANQHERKGSAGVRAKGSGDLRSTSPITVTTTLVRPQHGNLSLFPRTPTTPRVRKGVSTTSLREVTTADDIDDRPSRSRG
ncbi:conserved hypothetical protein [Talaromyces stipitatus ATCC 10500]|uniref:Uncharacterized protein n=1 Tax=Talaromyces stipitatus (strain ATCC 10500 / CBS 375.48 / QM 6759 / NRRL 1006) TaxID=441959 RepID=B8LT86_TALSN|nr:uncharacterized protein TSTA_070080 [Talaromyces stipitatus ATCC 10500]EED23594.1 conserved hypothetical protein [Talaromyces stipitatus ATCC 10500]